MSVVTKNGDLLTVNQFITEMQISRTTAYFWRRDGYGPRFFHVGQGQERPAIRYRRSDVAEWLAERQGK